MALIVAQTQTQTLVKNSINYCLYGSLILFYLYWALLSS